MIADILTAFQKITFNHDTLNKFFDVRVIAAAVKNFAYDTNLLSIFLVGVGVIGVYDHSWIQKVFL